MMMTPCIQRCSIRVKVELNAPVSWVAIKYIERGTLAKIVYQHSTFFKSGDKGQKSYGMTNGFAFSMPILMCPQRHKFLVYRKTTLIQ